MTPCAAGLAAAPTPQLTASARIASIEAATLSIEAMPSTVLSSPAAPIIVGERRRLLAIGVEPLLQSLRIVVRRGRCRRRPRSRRPASRSATAGPTRRRRTRSPRRASCPCAAACASSASACATVRGKPSRMKPRRASSSSMRSATMPTTMSSDTSAPESITAFALQADRRAGADGGAQHVARRELRDAMLGDEACRLRPLPRSRRPKENEPHQRLLPFSLDLRTRPSY